jgi:hypothetical protein
MNNTSNFEQFWDTFIQSHPHLKGKRYPAALKSIKALLQ